MIEAFVSGETSPTPSESSAIRGFVVPAIAVVACILMLAYGIHMRRPIVFDEIGLQNPVYVFYSTGHMTYPMHGQPDFMVVHPPTHYAIVALMMKLGLPLFAAAAVPLIVLTVILALVIVTGPFSAATAVGLLLGYFVAMTTWSEFYTLRPDLHVTAAWFTGLVTLESARLRNWSTGRLFLGSALAVLAATVHYWGITALALPLIYSAVLVWKRGFWYSRRQLLAVAAGGCLVGVPFLVWFVVPLYGQIMQMIGSVQGNGTPADAFARHLRSYSAFAQRLHDNIAPRWLSSVMAFPALTLPVPAVFIAVPALAWNKDTRVLAFAGALLPLFVLFFSQGKQVGYTGYFTPEFVLMFAGILIALLRIAERLQPRVVHRTPWLVSLIVAIAIAAFIGVPISMTNILGDRVSTGWAWTKGLDTLDVLRGAAQRVIGRPAVVAVTSAGVWYTGGGTYVWNAFDELTSANQHGNDVTPMLGSVDAVVLDTNWWNARKDLAPIGTWYVDRRLHLKGFVLPTDNLSRHMMQLFVGTTSTDRVRGLYVDQAGAREFVEQPAGSDLFVVLACPNLAKVSEFPSAYYRFVFAYDREPTPSSPSIVLLGMPASQSVAIDQMTTTGCVVRDSRRGDLRDIGRDGLRTNVRTDPPIQFFTSGRAAMVAAGHAVMRRVPMSIDWGRVSFTLDGPSRTLPLTLVAPAQQWAYEAVVPFTTTEAVAGLTLRLDVDVTTSQAGFGVLTSNQHDFVVRQLVEPKPLRQIIELTIPGGLDTVGPLVIQNGERATATHVIVHSIEATRVAPLEIR